MQAVETIAGQFPIGIIDEIHEIRSGLMHSTYAVESEEGRFTLQRLHKKLSTPEIINDYEAVTQYLDASDLPAPLLIRTRQDKPVYADEAISDLGPG